MKAKLLLFAPVLLSVSLADKAVASPSIYDSYLRGRARGLQARASPIPSSGSSPVSSEYLALPGQALYQICPPSGHGVTLIQQNILVETSTPDESFGYCGYHNSVNDPASPRSALDGDCYFNAITGGDLEDQGSCGTISKVLPSTCYASCPRTMSNGWALNALLLESSLYGEGDLEGKRILQCTYADVNYDFAQCSFDALSGVLVGDTQQYSGDTTIEGTGLCKSLGVVPAKALCLAAITGNST